MERPAGFFSRENAVLAFFGHVFISVDEFSQDLGLDQWLAVRNI